MSVEFAPNIKRLFAQRQTKFRPSTKAHHTFLHYPGNPYQPIGLPTEKPKKEVKEFTERLCYNG